jgi:hypothetical protein
MKTNKELNQMAVKLMAKYVNFETVLKHAENSELKEICVKKHNRVKAPELSVKQFCDNIIKDKLTSIAKSLPNSGYSMGDLKEVFCGKLKGSDNCKKYYSGKYSGSERHGYIKYNILPSELPFFHVIGSVATFIYPGQKSKVKKCYWLSISSKYAKCCDVVKVEGFIFAGYHSTSKNGALEGGKRNLKSELQFKKALRKQYTFHDSLNCGNCEIGTRAFILRLGLNSAKKYRGQYLLNLATEKSPSSLNYIRQMINYKA